MGSKKYYLENTLFPGCIFKYITAGSYNEVWGVERLSPTLEEELGVGAEDVVLRIGAQKASSREAKTCEKEIGNVRKIGKYGIGIYKFDCTPGKYAYSFQQRAIMDVQKAMEGSMDESFKKDILEGCIEAIKYMFSKGMLCYDNKPENFLIVKDIDGVFQIKVGDLDDKFCEYFQPGGKQIDFYKTFQHMQIMQLLMVNYQSLVDTKVPESARYTLQKANAAVAKKYCLMDKKHKERVAWIMNYYNRKRSQWYSFKRITKRARLRKTSRMGVKASTRKAAYAKPRSRRERFSKIFEDDAEFTVFRKFAKKFEDTIWVFMRYAAGAYDSTGTFVKKLYKSTGNERTNLDKLYACLCGDQAQCPVIKIGMWDSFMSLDSFKGSIYASARSRLDSFKGSLYTSARSRLTSFG